MSDHEEPTVYKRRKEDGLSYRIKYLGLLAASLLSIGALILGVGNVFWQTKSDAAACERRLDTANNEQDKTLVEMKTDLKYIKEGITELKERMPRK